MLQPRNLIVTWLTKVVKSDEEWKKILSPEQYQVLRQQGTEYAFSGAYHDHKVKGTYTCAGCGNKLFTSETKFRSGSGWPSFYQPISETNVGIEEDRTYRHGPNRGPLRSM